MMKLEILKHMSQNLDSTEYNHVFKLLEELEITYVMDFYIPKGTLISRIRQSKIVPFKRENQISYNPTPTDYGRANIPNEPIFYGSFQGPQMLDTLDTNFCEWMNIFNKKSLNEIGFPKDFTAGFWEVQENLPILPIIYGSAYKKRFPLFDQLKENYEKHEGVTEASKSIIEFLSNEFSKANINNPNIDYKITAAFSELIRNRVGDKFPAILYPSVRAADDGCNVAITPDGVKRYLKLKRVETFTAYDNKGSLRLEKKKIVTKINPDGTFELPSISNL
ncbi:hypothetical protein [Zobellia russellii]|uniref:hypothetical protein n=1 Tax=Zobellia russellii TaxID=248907 RepID=UPI0037DDC78F